MPAANKVTWDATAGGDYDGYVPSEKRAYDETLWSQGILKVITKLSQARDYNLQPNWIISGSAAAEKIQGLTGFKPVVLGPQDMDLSTGAQRDMGTMSSLGVRVLVDPQYATNKLLFGRRPTSNFDPCLHYCPYRPLRTTGTLETPNEGTLEKGVYSRFGVAMPDVATAPSCSQLADVYGELTMSGLQSPGPKLRPRPPSYGGSARPGAAVLGSWFDRRAQNPPEAFCLASQVRSMPVWAWARVTREWRSRYV